MAYVLQLLVTGIMIGAIYSLIGLGFVVIYKCSRVFNLAHGEFVLFGSYIAWTSITWWHLPIWLSIPVALAAGALVGLLSERFVVRPLLGQSMLALVLVTLGLAAVLRGIMLLVWAFEFRPYPRIIEPKSLSLAGVTVSQEQLGFFLISVLLLVLFVLFFRFTRVGLGMRTVAEDTQVARSMGISVKLIISLAWSVAAIVAAAGGILLGNLYGVGPPLADIGLRALAVPLAGGLESIPGVILAGILVGVSESLGAGYIGAGIREVIPFLVIVLVLIIRPYGIFGLKTIERV